MSKQGILIAVAQDQTGTSPAIVTPDYPFPVTIADSLINASSEPSLIDATNNGSVYSLSGAYSIVNGNNLAMNITFSAKTVIHYVSTDEGLPLYIHDALSTGSADGIIAPRNRNLISDDVSPTTSQLIYAATGTGNILSAGNTNVHPYIISDSAHPLSIVVNNNTGTTKTVRITVLYEEIGERDAALGLTPSTNLIATREMSDYG